MHLAENAFIAKLSSSKQLQLNWVGLIVKFSNTTRPPHTTATRPPTHPPTRNSSDLAGKAQFQ